MGVEGRAPRCGAACAAAGQAPSGLGARTRQGKEEVCTEGKRTVKGGERAHRAWGPPTCIGLWGCINSGVLGHTARLDARWRGMGAQLIKQQGGKAKGPLPRGEEQSVSLAEGKTC